MWQLLYPKWFQDIIGSIVIPPLQAGWRGNSQVMAVIPEMSTSTQSKGKSPHP